MRFLITGLGSIGRRHAQNIRQLCPQAEILAWRTRKEDLDGFEARNGIKIFDSFELALDQRPDAVLVTNPSSLHLRTAMLAAQRGAALFIEKPLSHTLDGIEEFERICRQKNIPVMLGHKLRFHPSIKQIHAWIQNGAIGRVLFARAYYGGYLPDWHPWEDYRRMYSSRRELGGGVILDAIHELDYLRWFCGDHEAVECFHARTGVLEVDTEDMAEILIRFKGGAIGSAHLSYVEKPEKRGCRIVGEQGVINWDQDSRRVEWVDRASGRKEIYLEPDDFVPNQVFLDQMKSFLHSVEKRIYDPESLRFEIRTLELAFEAKRKGDIHEKE